MDWQDAIFAPGWVWSMLSIVFVVGSLLGLYRQLRLQTSQGAIEQLDSFDREWDSERLIHHKLDVLVGLSADPPELPFGAAMNVANFLERIASLTRFGHIDQTLLARESGDRIRLWWMILEPLAQRWRGEGQQEFLLDLEWLAGAIAESERKAGTLIVYDDARLGSMLGRMIASLQDQLRIEQELRSVTIAPQGPGSRGRR